MLLPSSKTTKYQNKEKHCKKYCMCFYSANPGLLLTVRKKMPMCNQGMLIATVQRPTHTRLHTVKAFVI